MSEEKIDETDLVYDTGNVFDDRLAFALTLLKQANAEAEEFDGKRYTTVAKRVEVFRRAFGPLAQIATDIEHCDDNVVRATATIALCVDGVFYLVATGHAEEWRHSSDLNMTSALENAETSAIGRALASLGLHGGQFATAEEVEAAMAEKEVLRRSAATEFLQPEEIAAAVEGIKKCTTESQLAETYIKFSPALKVATQHVKDAKLRQLREQPAGTETAKADSPPPPSAPPAASPRRRAQSSGDA